MCAVEKEAYAQVEAQEEKDEAAQQVKLLTLWTGLEWRLLLVSC